MNTFEEGEEIMEEEVETSSIRITLATTSKDANFSNQGN
jgi:hypothetical protein